MAEKELSVKEAVSGAGKPGIQADRVISFVNDGISINYATVGAAGGVALRVKSGDSKCKETRREEQILPINIFEKSLVFLSLGLAAVLAA